MTQGIKLSARVRLGAPSPWRWAVIILGAGFAAMIGDYTHVLYGVLFYPHPWMFGQAWWVFPLFSSAAALMFALVDPVRRAWGPAISLPTYSDADAVWGMLGFLGAYFFTSIAVDWPTTVLLVLCATWLYRVRSSPRWVLGYAALIAVGGVCFEASLSHAGGFYYSKPDFMGVARWLPALYLHAALAAPPIRELL